MTSPLQPVARLSERVTKLERQRVTQRVATVVAVHSATSTFDADVEGAGRLNGIPAPAAFMPAVGDRVTLDLRGATPVYQPGRIAEGAVGEDELAPMVAVKLDAAAGKTEVTFSPDVASGTDHDDGDVWFRRDTNGVITGSWEWDGAAWQPRTFGDAVLNSLTVGKIVSGTGVFDMLMAGSLYSATSGSRYRIDATGIKLYSGSNTTPTVDLDATTGRATFRGIVEGALFRTSGAGQRLEIQSGGTAGGRTLSFYPAGAGMAATVYSRDDGAGNAGLTLTAGGANRGFLNFNSTFADIGYGSESSAASWVRANATSALFGLELTSVTDMSVTAPRTRYFEGTYTYAILSRANGLNKVGKFSLLGPADAGAGSEVSSFTFGQMPGASDADVYALRFISTNEGGTGGFVYFSDGRLKRDERPATFDALAQLMATPVMEFEWKATGETSFGFVAQQTPADVQVHLSPDRPIDGVDNPVGVAAEQMMAKLVKAVQQLNVKVEAIRAGRP